MITGGRNFSIRHSIRLRDCTLGATTVAYVGVLATVALVGSVAFAALEDSVRSAVLAETAAVSELTGEDVDGPTGSLAAEVANAGAEQLVVQGSWALAAKGGVGALAAARKGHRGRARSDGSQSPTPTRNRSVDSRSPTPTPERPEGSQPRCPGGVCAGGDTCFVAGTPVLTREGMRPIETIRAGDMIVSEDERTGTISVRPVARTFVLATQSVVDIRILGMLGEETVVRATPEHPFFVLGLGWVDAGALAVGDHLASTEDSEVQVIEVTPLDLSTKVYNFEVEETHTYFVGDIPVLVHNAGSPYGQVYVIVMSTDGQYVLTATKNQRSRAWGGEASRPGQDNVTNRPPDGVPSFPGGGLEAGDRETNGTAIDPVQGGFREFHEETGVDLRDYAHAREVVNFDGYSVVVVTMSAEELARLQADVNDNLQDFREWLDHTDQRPELTRQERRDRIRHYSQEFQIRDEELQTAAVMTVADARQRFATNRGNRNHRQSTDWFEAALDTVGELRRSPGGYVNRNGTTNTAVIRNPETGHYEVYTGRRNANPTFTDNLSRKDETRTKTYDPRTGNVTTSRYDANPRCRR